MGYYTKFSLEVRDTETTVAEFIDEWAAQGNDYVAYCLKDEQESKWYKHEADLQAFSKIHPDVTFVLNGAGEDSGDIWKLYATNGVTRRVKARIVFDEL